MKIIFITIFFITSQNAYAYIDLGTGSYLLQIFIGAFTAALVTGKIFLTQIKIFFNNIFKSKSNSNKEHKNTTKDSK